MIKRHAMKNCGGLRLIPSIMGKILVGVGTVNWGSKPNPPPAIPTLPGPYNLGRLCSSYSTVGDDS